jgi:CRISPR/Cas system-associated exonuclease Cas4 (RecB family)
MKYKKYKLSPSDFAFLFEGCKRCYYLKVVYNISPPSIPLPSIFSKIAVLLKDYYKDKRTEELHPNLPPGTVIYGERKVISQIIKLPDHNHTCFISGRFDIVVKFDDGTYGVIDFKTGNPEEENYEHYRWQLHAYAYALEHPAKGALKLSPISKMGLLYFNPSKISQPPGNIKQLSYDSEIRWLEIDKNEQKFLNFVGKVLNVLKSSKPPEPSRECPWCNYLRKLKNSRLVI